MDMEPYLYIIAVLGGLAAGFINTLAGNGSVITLTILTELIGLPGNLANGTNRVGVMANSVMASWVFHKNGKLKLDRGLPYIVPTVLGAVVGVIVAVMVSNEQFKIVFRFLMVVMLLVILIKPK
ncbi:MAG: putative membrane protein YfcA, partial [Saprospiraceae bacterium]